MSEAAFWGVVAMGLVLQSLDGARIVATMAGWVP